MPTANILGCTNPAAANFNPNANQDDGSCVYVNKVAGTCYAFQDAAGVEDQSFTLSWSLAGANNWVFFHDFIPDYYFSVREQLFNLKSGQVYEHNAGNPGIYHDPTRIYPFFLDVVFKARDSSNPELTLNAVNWITTVLNADGSTAPFDTLTHITVWNSYQCSGRIALSQIFQDLQYEVRKTAGSWSFDDFRNLLNNQGVAFLDTIFNNFAVLSGAIDPTLPWYEQELLEDDYFIIRFEFDNTSGKKIYLQETGIDTNQSFR